MAEAALWIPARPEVAGVSPDPAPHPQACAPSPPPGRSRLKLLLRAGCPRRPVVPSPPGAPSAASSGDKGTANPGREKQFPERGERKKKNQVTPLHAALRKRKGRRDTLIGSDLLLPLEQSPERFSRSRGCEGRHSRRASHLLGASCTPVLRMLQRN